TRDQPPPEKVPASDGEAVTDLLDEMALPGADPAVAAGGGASEPIADEPPDQDPTRPVADAAPERAPETPDVPVAAPRDWLNWNEIETELGRARGLGKAGLEDALDELIAEYERSLEHAESEPVRQAMNSRLDWLRLRKSARDQRLALDATLMKAAELRSSASLRVRTWQSGRYDIVGRLVHSAVYDGRRLPRMYRVRAAGDTGLVRTIGYVRDVPALGLESKIGRVVGVVGQSRFDDALHLRVITPVRIDTLEARGEPQVAPEG
ncbi:MAG: hypothetical protein K8E66_02605, partial [Phycisphaerales bacterium]|nr:hypothetical protein [Phycisphaerales bacterium]